MQRNFYYIFSILPAIACVTGNILGGWFTLMNTFLSLIVFGIFEYFFGENKKNTENNHSAFPEFIILLHVFMHSVVLFSLGFQIYTGKLAGIFLVFASISCGIETGTSAIVVAHELIHKAVFVKRILGKYLLITAGNPYFYSHHLLVHHKLVGHKEDAATARFNESFYAFYFRTVCYQLLQAVKIDNYLVSKTGKWWNHTVMQMILAITVYLFFVKLLLGLNGLLATILVFTMGSILLEYVNYIEHYGLERLTDERVNETHSWQTDKVISRFLLIDLSRHSDHHFYASKPYHTLDSHEKSPVLPGGYASLIIPAFIPVWWKKLVHKRLLEFRKSK